MSSIEIQQPERHIVMQTSTSIIENIDDTSIPVCDDSLDLDKLDDNVKLQDAIVPLIRNIEGWGDVTEGSQLIVSRVSCALTNYVFFIGKHTTNQKVVLRIYGKGVDQFCNREEELKWLKILSPYGIGPLLLLIFSNGRFEKYFDSTPLNSKHFRDPNTYINIAERISALHKIVHIHLPDNNVNPLVWANIDKWYALVIGAFQNFSKKQKIALKKFDLLSLGSDIRTLKEMLKIIDSPIVLAHNDLQPGNILRLNDGSDELVAVDFEYAGYNYRGFDLGNFFCEAMFNYNSTDPHILHKEWYPKNDDKLKFLKSYLGFNDSTSTISDDLLKKLVIECDAFALASHVMWGLWALIQSLQSNIEFKYFEYGMLRLKAFRARKNKIYKRIEKSFT